MSTDINEYTPDIKNALTVFVSMNLYINYKLQSKYSIVTSV